MKVRDDIQQFSTPEDRPILEWLFNRYHWASQWSFVATFSPQCYGTESYKIHRVWKPTVEGRAIYAQLSGAKCPQCRGSGEVETGIGMLLCEQCHGPGAFQ